MARPTSTASNTTWQNRSELAIAGGALTNSKRPQCFVQGVYPTHLARGQGCMVWDTDGKKYVDFVCGLGANLLGYGNTEIAHAVSARLKDGISLSLGTPLEVEAAEQIKALFPFVDRIRFLKTGSDACTAAIRIARTYRNKGKVFSEGYHGWHDEFVSLTPPALGVYGEFPTEKLTDIQDIDYETAAVIVEPIQTNDGPERVTWLRALRERCTQVGAVLIFDEVITGLRFPGHSVARRLGIIPDLICLGKAIGGGLPLSVVGGRREIMECGEYFVSSTFAGDTAALAASLKTFQLVTTKYDIQHLWEKGEAFQRSFNAIHPEGIRIQGYGTRGAFVGDEMTKALFWQEACRAGLLFGPSVFFCFPHMDVLDPVLNACRDILTRIQTGSVKLIGELPKSPFSQRARTQ